MKLLVTGGAGFIGSHLCEMMLKAAHEVVCVDNFCDFYDPKIKWSNLEHCLQDNRFRLFKGDIRDRDFLDELILKEDYDAIVHLAAMAGVRPSIEKSQLYYDVNINGTFNLLESIKENTQEKNRPKIIYASSSSVYGNNQKVPFSENDPVDNPISPYAVTKKAGELMCYNYHHLYSLTVIALRFFTVYGPRQRPDLAIHKFAKLILDEKSIPVFGNGSTKRDYTYIDDIIQGVVKAIDYALDTKDRPLYEIFNLGESRTISLNQMIIALEEHLNKKAIKKGLPAQPGDVKQTYADITKSRDLLGYNPSFEFDEGIELFSQWLNRK